MQRSLESYGDVQAMRNGLAAQLKPHQRRCVDAVVKQRRVLIADVMGLGKTASALAALEETGEYPCAIVTPASAEQGILRECQRWLPWRSAGICDGFVPATEIVILHPEVLERHQLRLLARGIKSVVLDESHFFKNPASARSRAVDALAGRCDVRILLSGTPIKNRRQDLVHQLKILGRYDEVMLAAYRNAGLTIPPLQDGRRYWGINAVPATALHKALEQTVMLRSTHAKARTGIPKVARKEIKCEGSTSKEYQALEAQFVAYCKEVSLMDPADSLARGKAAMQAARILQGMRTALGSAKLGKVLEWANELLEKGRKGVVFTFHRSVAMGLVQRLPGRKAAITGETPPKQRQAIVDRMRDLDFIVATMDTMSHAVNGLQQHAQDLAFVELDHTHSKHEQAEGRLRRQGQTKPVRAFYLVAPDTYDEALLASLAKKWKDAAGVLDGKNAVKGINFAELVLHNVIQQRPWETGQGIDWKAAGTRHANIQKGNAVSKPGRQGPQTGRVGWVNTSRTSCRVEWEGGLVTFEVPQQLRVLDKAL